ncbi:MAG: hypothetical protein HOW97_18350 [Catenulispora sp.]|nr:hypothetical protein [Catenulispora sp.]
MIFAAAAVSAAAFFPRVPTGPPLPGVMVLLDPALVRLMPSPVLPRPPGRVARARQGGPGRSPPEVEFAH